jgi:thiol-disulfide isomerase/thioredoxin
VWLGAAVDATLGLRAAVHLLTATLTLDLGVLVIAALGVFAAAGPRREMGRAFDLACVAVLPLVLVELVATGVTRGLELEPPAGVMLAASAVGYGWTLALLGLAVQQARAAGEAEVPGARWAGRVLAGLTAALLALQVAFVAGHLERLRPLTAGAHAPPFALASIGPHGALGPRVELPHDRPVVIDFWATWCGPCLEALPRLDAFARRHPEVAVLAVNLDDPAAARALFDERGYTPALIADDGETSQRFGVSTIPHTVVIDREGRVRQVARGGVIDLDAAVR